ncbi:FAD-dependent oxidoreductase [Oscillospiraceae bacterium CM]|nr:FAD-dependent oxidoreductase [Oscillospiraceae bacterium CM]
MQHNTISNWNLTGEKTHYPRLTKSLTADVCIIGAGITGVTCAYCLAKKGFKPLLIEAGGISDGTTGNTTGKVTIQHDIIYSRILKKYGLDTARDYAASQQIALDFVKSVVFSESINCQLTENTAYIFARNEKEWEDVQKEHAAATSVGIASALLEKPTFPVENIGMMGFPAQAVFHPVRYVNALANAAVKRGAVIHGGTKAIKIEKTDDVVRVYCEDDIVIAAKHVVEATQYPLYDGPNVFFARLYPKRTYGIAVRAKGDWAEGSFISAGMPTRSFRTHLENGEKILIAVGDSHLTGRGARDMTVHFNNLMGYADRLAGVKEVLAMWSAQDYDTPDMIPYIGRTSERSNIYVATGFKKWGLSTGTLAGMMIADLIDKGSCRFEGLYSRTRGDLIAAPGKTLYGILSPIAELLKSKLEGTDDLSGLQPGEGRVIRFEGQKAGIYRDENDDVTILDITCTHMGTELRFNTAEKTWDCPAHGGRYDASGALLEGPPKDSLKILFRGKFDDLPTGT